MAVHIGESVVDQAGTHVAQPPLLIPTLVVDPDLADRCFVSESLEAAGFAVAAVATFQEAKALLIVQAPVVLVTEIRLGAFNGLQLALRAAAATPRISVIAMSRVPDPVLQRDAECAGATFALKPISREELLAAVYRTILRRPGPSGADELIRPPFERRRAERRSALAVVVEPDRRAGDRRGKVNRVLGALAST